MKIYQALQKGKLKMTKEKKKIIDEEPREDISNEIKKNAKEGKLPCAVAFQIAESLGVQPGDVGKTADILNVKLEKCQLGLFGHDPENKKVKPDHEAASKLKGAIEPEVTDGRLACRTVWEISARLDVSKMKISNACEAMGIKIDKCQLGAF